MLGVQAFEFGDELAKHAGLSRSTQDFDRDETPQSHLLRFDPGGAYVRWQIDPIAELKIDKLNRKLGRQACGRNG